MENLNKFTKKYLEENGIKINYFAQWIGCDRTQVGRWLSGKRPLPHKYLRSVLDFLASEHVKEANLDE